jgi:CheY-like chemotaxis protein
LQTLSEKAKEKTSAAANYDALELSTDHITDRRQSFPEAGHRANTHEGWLSSVGCWWTDRSAYSLLQNSLPDLILLDLMLPYLVGALKNSPATADIPVVVLTGLAQLNEVKLLGVGSGYVEKSSLSGRRRT